MDRAELEGLDRESLVLRAQAAGIKRARILTRPELIDELLRLDPRIDPDKLRRSRGFFGVARDLLSRVVERGLHLPDAADRIARALATPVADPKRPEPQAVPTVTLAGIYAAQGHKARAVETLKRVLDREPDHVAARTLLEKLEDVTYVAPAPPLPPEREEQEAAATDAEADAPQSSLDPDPHGTRLTIMAPDPDGTRPTTPPRALPPLVVAKSDAECIAIPIAERRIFVWFRVSGTRAERFVVRALIVTPSWDRPISETRDLVCEPESGEVTLDGFPESCVVRVAIGWGTGASFLPVASSPLFERGTSGLVRWTLSGTVPVVLDDPRFASVAAAFGRALLAE